MKIKHLEFFSQLLSKFAVCKLLYSTYTRDIISLPSLSVLFKEWEEIHMNHSIFKRAWNVK